MSADQYHISGQVGAVDPNAWKGRRALQRLRGTLPSPFQEGIHTLDPIEGRDFVIEARAADGAVTVSQASLPN